MLSEWISLSPKQTHTGTHVPANPNRLCQQAETDGTDAAQRAARLHPVAAGTSQPGREALSMVLNRLLTPSLLMLSIAAAS